MDSKGKLEIEFTRELVVDNNLKDSLMVQYKDKDENKKKTRKLQNEQSFVEVIPFQRQTEGKKLTENL